MGPPRQLVQFHRFELDPARYELRADGERLKLQRIPMDLLILLVERRGELVTREEILARVWREPPEDAEHGVNTAIRKLRQALRDDAEHPRFIETVVGKGYRFVAEVKAPEAVNDSAGALPEEPEAQTRMARAARAAVLWAGLAAVIAGIAAAGYSASRMYSGGLPANSLTASPFTAMPGSELWPRFSPDGQTVAFSWKPADGSSQHIYIKRVGADTATALTSSEGRDFCPSWSPDGGSVAFLRFERDRSASLWAVDVSDRRERKLRTVAAPNLFAPAWVPDGSAVVVAESDPPGAPPRLRRWPVSGGPGAVLTPSTGTGTGDWHAVYSPDGKRLAYVRGPGSSRASTLLVAEVEADGRPRGEPRPLPSQPQGVTDLAWTPDSASLVAVANGSARILPVGGGQEKTLPFFGLEHLSISRLRGRLVYSVVTWDIDIYRVPGPGHSGGAGPHIDSTKVDSAPDYSPDGTRIAFVSDRNGAKQVWIAGADGANPRQLTSVAGTGAGCPRWSPDGRFIAFDSVDNARSRVYVVRAEFGATPVAITDSGANQVRPSWSKSGGWVYFGSDRTGKWEIWKTQPSGGRLVQVTQSGGREALEDADGRFLYYVRDRETAGIWRRPVAGGAEERVAAEGRQGRWTLGEKGVYLEDGQFRIRLRPFAGGSDIVIPTGTLDLRNTTGGRSLAIGPGDRWILATALARFESDLTLAENVEW